LFQILIFLISKKLASLSIRPIQENNSKLREYNHYVAHELKTPLAVMRSNLELLELTGEKELFSSTKEEISSMQHIIDGLLFLSEIGVKKQKEEVDLEKFFSHFKEQFNEKERIIIEVKKTPIKIKAFPFLLERLTKNLLENAFKY
jgi:signal transduction histidine kinase